jgi:dihydroorotase
MLNRREFLATAAAGAATLSLERRSFSAQPKYDLLIKGGRVIDPSLHLDGIRDVAITAGRIVSVDATITAEAADTIDARGKLVVPGLIDIHTHGLESAAGPPMMLDDGVTGFIVPARRALTTLPTRLRRRRRRLSGRVLINIGRFRDLADGDTMELARPMSLRRKTPSPGTATVVGIKARCRGTWPASTITKCSAARRKWRARSICP